MGAVLGPVAVFVWAFQLLTPVRQLGGSAVAIDRLLRQQRAEVLVVGASFAGSDIDGPSLGRRLSPSGSEALILQLSASSAAVWYAALKERVYGHGHRPGLIVMPVSLTTAMLTRLPPGHMAMLSEQMPVPDEVVVRRSFGNDRFPAWQRILDARRSVRDLGLHAFRDAPPQLLLGRGGAAVEAAGVSVFGEHHEAAGQRALPAAEMTEGEAGVDGRGWMVSDPDESYLSDLADLADRHGARLVVVLPPTIEVKGQSLAPEVEAAVVAWAARRGVGLLDYRKLGWGASQFRDGLHMTKTAAKEFSDLVADGIQALEGAGVLDVEWMGELVPSVVVRTGEPPALPPVEWVAGAEPCAGAVPVPGFELLGKRALARVVPGVESPIELWEGGRVLPAPLGKGECSGSATHRVAFVVSRREAAGAPLSLRWSAAVPTGTAADPAYWVLPGTTLTWTFSAPWGGAVAGIDLEAVVVGDGVGAPVLAAGAVSTPVSVEAGGATASLVPPPAGGWTASVSSPPDGPYLLVRTLAARVGGASRNLVPPPRERRLDLLRAGRWSVASALPEPPKVPVGYDPAGASFELGWVASVDCSPVRVSHGGTLLPEARPGKAASGTRHIQTRLTFAPLPGTSAEEDYAVAYDPDRGCKRLCSACAEQLWLYPGERLLSVVPERDRAVADAVLGRMVLDVLPAWPPDAAAARLRVTLALGDEALLDIEVLPEQFSTVLDLPLSRPLRSAERGELRTVFQADALLPPLLVTSSLEEP